MRAPLLNPYRDLHRALGPAPAAGVRKPLIWAYAWAIPSDEAIHAIAELGPILELGAGTGYWAWLLRQAGVDVLAFDRQPGAPPRWSEVRPGDESAVGTPGTAGRALLLCWPPLDEPMAARALARHAAGGGKLVAYVGEARGAASRTADAGFRATLERDYELVRRIEIPRWPGFEDALHLFRKHP